MATGTQVFRGGISHSGGVSPLITSAADTTTKLTAAYARDLYVTGTASLQWFNLGDASQYANTGEDGFRIYNKSTRFLGVRSNHATAASASVWRRVPPGALLECILIDNTTTGGASGGEKEGTWHVVETLGRPELGGRIFDDFTGSRFAANAGIGSISDTAMSNGTGAALAASNTASNKTSGILRAESGTDTNSYGGGYLANVYLPGAGTFSCEYRVCVSALSVVADEYIVRAGFGNNKTGGAHTRGCYFLYDRLTYGDFWAIRNINASGNNTVTTSVVPAVANSDENYQTLRVEISGVSRADYWINREQVSASGGLATYMPEATDAIQHIFGITKSAGSTEIYLRTDWHEVQNWYDTIRV